MLRRSMVALTALLVGLAAGCSGEDETDPNAITIGLLLPFTGSSSATASNFERSVIWAADRINDGGGVQGRRVRVVARDTHSELARSEQSARELLEEGAAVVLGPESAEIATALAPRFAEHDTVFLSPLVGAAADTGTDCEHPWFRLAPSARNLGEALGKQLAAENVKKAAIVYAAGAYNEALITAVRRLFTTRGGTVPLALMIDPNAQTYASEINQLLAVDVDAVVLATSPRTGALVINEFYALSSQPPRWFLSPLLKTDLLVQNVAPEALQNALGVAPKIYDLSDQFPNAFERRWMGDLPLEGAYFYYDAMGLLAFALQNAEFTADGRLDHESLETAIRRAAAPPGEAMGWNEIELGLERLRAGDVIYYSGLTGPMILERCGPRQLGRASTWTVDAGAIVDVGEDG